MSVCEGRTVNCPQCGAVSRVLQTRGNTRRRECFNLHRFSTTEVVVPEAARPGAYGVDVNEGMRQAAAALQAKREAVAHAPGKLKDVAAQYGVSVNTVWTWRRKYGAQPHTPGAR